jgi:hypothetical protein
MINLTTKMNLQKLETTMQFIDLTLFWVIIEDLRMLAILIFRRIKALPNQFVYHWNYFNC